MEVLYTSNTFHFRGSSGLFAFQNSIPVFQWQALRHIHVSTSLRCPMADWDHLNETLPESKQRWNRMCDVLRQLQLLSLSFDINYRYRDHYSVISSIDDESLLLPLEALASLKVDEFKVEVNVEISEVVADRFKEGPFKLSFNRRMYRHLKFLAL